MFVQVIEGRVSDADRLQAQLERWRADLSAGAAGWLGATSGVAEDGTGIAMIRFTSAEAAQANSDRPEQGAWWRDTEACFDGEVTFTDYAEGEEMMGGGSDAAGFVQVIRGRLTDLEEVRRRMDGMEEEVAAARPDVMGGYVATQPDGHYVQVVYFTSEEEARRGEAADDGADRMADLQAEPVTFVDLRDPRMMSP